MIVLESMMPPAWKAEMEPMENQDALDWTDLWLEFDRTDADDRTEMFESKLDELIDERAETGKDIG